jgi:superfamily I DNA/RNA helicase
MLRNFDRHDQAESRAGRCRSIPGNVVITACPGSGKTRVLTARVIRGLGELSSKRECVVALTFTNRAADEIQTRLDQENVEAGGLWAGTIHGFALEWVLRPYAPYCDELRHGFSVADEYYCQQLIKTLKAEEGVRPFDDVNTAISRTGLTDNADGRRRAVFARYKQKLRENKMIDYDDVLYLAYKILTENKEAAATLGSIIRLICVDEVQDIQDLQFGILRSIYVAAATPPILFFVGDANQSIYESLGALTKTPAEIAAEFELTDIGHLQLSGNYRSTQRIIDYYRQLRAGVPAIESLADYAEEHGRITFHNQTIHKDDLAEAIAALITASLAEGVSYADICILAPQWWHVRPLTRQLIRLLPGVPFDAPGLCPLYSSRDNIWYKIGRLFLTEPAPARARTRSRWAREVIADIGAHGVTLGLYDVATERRILRTINSISSSEEQGIEYLRDVFDQFLERMGVQLPAFEALTAAHTLFFEKAQHLIATSDGGMPTDVVSFRRFFSHPAGVVVNTCHGVKGEEFETVITFGLLGGVVPHWSVIRTPLVAEERESKLLYVICSRAKRRLHLIAEAGRATQSGNAYETAWLLNGIDFLYDA